MSAAESVMESLTAAAAENGLAVHCYQSNLDNRFSVRITYAAHPAGEGRPARSSDCQIVLATLSQREGSTERSEAFRPRTLVITGPQGCGKPTLARKIAEQYGAPFVETDATQIETPNGLNDLLASEPITVICDGVPERASAQSRLMAMIARGTAIVETGRGAPKTVRTPSFIFWACDAEHRPLAAADWDIDALELGAAVKIAPI